MQRLGSQFICGLRVVRACHRRLCGIFALARSRQRLKPLLVSMLHRQTGMAPLLNAAMAVVSLNRA
jgi:hypothetical protein